MDKEKLQQQIAEIVHSYLKNRNHLVLSIGILNNDEKATFLYTGSKVNINEDHIPFIYEIGSITKVFTTTLLGEMVQENLLSGNDSISQYFPQLPTDHPVTLKHLANHTSGLPSIGVGKSVANLFSPKTYRDPYCLFSLNEVIQYFNKHVKKPKMKFRYSNAGMGTLGNILGTRLHTDYEQAIKNRIVERLGMKDTFIMIPPEKENRLLKGFDVKGKEQLPLEMKEFMGAGALRSTADDILDFVKAHMDTENQAYQLTQQPSVNIAKNTSVGLGWILENETIWHNGSTQGFSSFLGFDKNRQIGVVVLSNYRSRLFASNPNQIGTDILQLLRTI